MENVQIPREHYLSKLMVQKDSGKIKIISGFRGCGKTALISMFIDELRNSGVSDEKIKYVDLKEMESSECDLRELLNLIKWNITDFENSYVFLDNVRDFELYKWALYSMYTCNADVYIAVSSRPNIHETDLLFNLVHEIRIRPLTFCEYLDFRDSGEMDGLLMDYIRFGGLPAVAVALDRMPNLAYDLLEGIYNTAFLNDVLFLNDIRNVANAGKLSRILMKDIGRKRSIRGVSKEISSKGVDVQPVTTDQYVSALVKGLLFDRVRRMDSKSKEYLRTSDKFYASDLGIRNNLIPFSERDLDGIMENMVYNELMFRYGEAAVYSVDGYEVDFIADPRGSPSYYQVCTDISEKSTRERELRSLKAIPDNYPKTVITFEKYPLRDIDGIRIVNIQDWLLEGKSPQV